MAGRVAAVRVSEPCTVKMVAGAVDQGKVQVRALDQAPIGKPMAAVGDSMPVSKLQFLVDVDKLTLAQGSVQVILEFKQTNPPAGKNPGSYTVKLEPTAAGIKLTGMGWNAPSDPSPAKGPFAGKTVLSTSGQVYNGSAASPNIAIDITYKNSPDQ
jgi:hypothetical protein